MLDNIVSTLNEVGWIHLPNCLSANQLKQINQYIEENKKEFVPALIGSGNKRQRMTEVRGDYTLWLDPLHPPVQFESLIKMLEDLRQNINKSLFLGLKEFECHLALYPSGTFYKKHSDRHEADSSRSISFVFYLHENWKPGNGGELVLYDKHDVKIKEIEPLPGSLVCFLSSDFPHEVKLSHQERRSLTGWMHTKIIN